MYSLLWSIWRSWGKELRASTGIMESEQTRSYQWLPFIKVSKQYVHTYVRSYKLTPEYLLYKDTHRPRLNHHYHTMIALSVHRIHELCSSLCFSSFVELYGREDGSIPATFQVWQCIALFWLPSALQLRWSQIAVYIAVDYGDLN